MRRVLLTLTLVCVLATAGPGVVLAAPNPTVGINVVLNGDVTDAALKELARFGKVLDVIHPIDALTMRVKAGDLAAIQALPFVAAANPDAERSYGPPWDAVPAESFGDGLSTWNLDAINVTDFGFNNRQVQFDGTGVYVAVLDTGLVNTWRHYFPEERIASQYARSFGGGGGLMGTVSEQPNKWERDTNSHGTHVTSTILGYSLDGVPVNGVAPKATVIPVKVLNQNGSGWSSVIARGITYIADLKAGPLKDYPVVINMSLGGSELDAVEKEAIDYAIEQGVIIVASAGNAGAAGMGYPGAYEPVISVAAAGWVGEWIPADFTWWYASDVPETSDPADYYITNFSSRALPGQDLDVAAPGSWIVGPYQTNSGQASYYFMGGTSMASPHVAGIVALMAQKDPDLTAAEADFILEETALDLPAWGEEAAGAGLVDAKAALE